MADTDHEDLSGYIRWPVITLALLAIMAALVLMRSFLMPVALAFLLALVFSPVRRVLQRRGIPPALTSALVVLSLFVGVTGLFLALAAPVQQYVADSGAIAYDVERKLRGISSALEKVGEAGDQLEELADGPASAGSDPGVEEVVIKGPGIVSRIATNAPFLAAQGIFTLVLLFFLIASGDMFYQKLVEASPTFRDKRTAISVTREIERRISRYFLTITLINAGLGAAIGLSLWLYGMPNALLFGVMGCLLNFIPYLGALAGIAVTFAIGIVSFDTVGQAFGAAGIYLFWTTLEGQILTPYAVGKRLSLNPVVVFIAVAFWGWAWSFIGMFIAVPLLIVTVAISERVRALNNLAIFLSGDSVRNGNGSSERAEAGADKAPAE